MSTRANECFNSEHAESLSILSCGTTLSPGCYLAANNGGHTTTALQLASGWREKPGRTLVTTRFTSHAW